MSNIYWLASYPKSGNTWLRTFIQNVIEDGEKPVHINDLHTGAIASSRYWLDETLGFDTADLHADEIDALRPTVYNWGGFDDELDASPNEALYHKVHDAYHYVAGQPLLGTKGIGGALYILRNPLDVAPSLANHYQCSIDHAIELMGQHQHCMARSTKKLTSQVRQQLFTWSEHVLSWIEAPSLARLVIRYEEMLYQPLPTFTRICQFLQLPSDPARVQKAITFSDFKELTRQENQEGFNECPSQTPKFFRQGKSGSWQQSLTPQQVTQIIHDHHDVMQRFGYLDTQGQPLVIPTDICEHIVQNPHAL
ncbi:sulfotransferase domain-containing protein [Celerinatantimonas sp. YJH-8]|uniref:sulfotransferase domain-containing protein n=1 Tax=Celerinatantimonas sp. YJH-8 TaxID=3228714 RepID=UPI0038CA27D5